MIEKIKKNNKKRNLNIAVATIASFMLSSGTIYGETITIDDSIKNDRTYTDETTILDAKPLDKGVIVQDGSTDKMTITANDLTINHKATHNSASSAPYNILGTIMIDDGDLDINVDSLNITSDFTERNPGGTSSGIVVSGNSYSDLGTLVLNAKEDININVKGGENGHKVGIEVTHFGNMEISSKNLNIKLDVPTTSGYSEGIRNEGEMAITTDNIKIDATTKGIVAGIYNGSYDLEINNSNSIEINVAGNGGGGQKAISNLGGITINSSNTILTATSTANRPNASGIDSSSGTVEINGGLEIKTIQNYSSSGETTIGTAVQTAGGIVDLNKNNEAVAVKIEGNLVSTSGTINLNLNGSDSYLIR